VGHVRRDLARFVDEDRRLDVRQHAGGQDGVGRVLVQGHRRVDDGVAAVARDDADRVFARCERRVVAHVAEGDGLEGRGAVDVDVYVRCVRAAVPDSDSWVGCHC
jgi:hypothetical protein